MHEFVFTTVGCLGKKYLEYIKIFVFVLLYLNPLLFLFSFDSGENMRPLQKHFKANRYHNKRFTLKTKVSIFQFVF